MSCPNTTASPSPPSERALPTARITSSTLPAKADPPWYAHLNVDTILLVLSRTIFHPFAVWMLPLSLRAMATSYSSTSFIVTATYASIINIIFLFGVLSEKYAYGKPREVDLEDEVVVVAGGKGGLGGCIAEVYGMRGVRTVVLDVTVSKEEEEKGEEEGGVRYYQCDVGNREHVEKTWARVSKEVGTPTVLVNCAAIVGAKRFVEISMDNVERIFRTNLLSQYHLNSLFLPPLLTRPSGGTLITVSSVLGTLGVSHLSAYTASKAALTAFHTSLTAELRSDAYPPNNIKTILVVPGQLDTPLFAGLEQNGIRNFFGPKVEAKEVAMNIVGMIDRGEGGEFRMPAYARWIAWMGVLPVGMQKALRGLSGVDEAGKMVAERAAMGNGHVEKI